MKKRSTPKSTIARKKHQQLAEIHESLRDTLRELSGLSEGKLWGGLAYRYDEQVFFTLTLRPRTVLIEMKLPDQEAERALGLGFVHPHSFTRLARNGWVAVSVTPEIPLDRVHELIDRSYWNRVETFPQVRRRSRRKRRDPQCHEEA
jgi:predicted DNA-binding protein (MmcQ/YjbR family)